MRLSEELWRESSDLAVACLNHPFVRGLADGSLPPERYALFIAQDAFFLEVDARAYAAGVYRSPDAESRRDWHELQCGVFAELKLHGAAAERLGIDLDRVTPLGATRAYTDFLLANTFGGTLAELAAAVAPCVRLYCHLGARIVAEGHPPHDYTQWAETYADLSFSGLVDRIEGLLDRHAGRTQGERDRYRQAMRLELEFFEQAWIG